MFHREFSEDQNCRRRLRTLNATRYSHGNQREKSFCQFVWPSSTPPTIQTIAIQNVGLIGSLMNMDAATIVLRLARESGQASKVMAMQGSYQQMLSGRTYQLMQVRVSPDTRVIPEASANKYMLWVRFTVQDGDLKPRAVDVDVPFHLTLCSL